MRSPIDAAFFLSGLTLYKDLDAAFFLSGHVDGEKRNAAARLQQIMLPLFFLEFPRNCFAQYFSDYAYHYAKSKFLIQN